MQHNTCSSEVQPIRTDDILFIALEIGEHILRCGGEISRAEDTIIRICRAYGATHVDVTAILSMIVLTVDFNDSRNTCTRRIRQAISPNLDKLTKINDLSRTICSEKPDKNEVVAKMAEISRSSQKSFKIFIIGNVLAALGFSIFFSDLSSITGETVLGIAADALLAGLLALPLCLILAWLEKSQISSIVSKFTVCFIGGVCAMLLGKALPICHPDIIMIGNSKSFHSPF